MRARGPLISLIYVTAAEADLARGGQLLTVKTCQNAAGAERQHREGLKLRTERGSHSECDPFGVRPHRHTPACRPLEETGIVKVITVEGTGATAKRNHNIFFTS
ncbi:hypothetical protein scyTo_0007347 [Scyliorhinus torazame]|uniref:Uncharacterized protein n=1 Tax=Scyliorhinus torazame TaxID=75743 RepID=A0A401NQM3_SCYTO|nr:hypothetical protein [Scyliorhinus torazame]